MKQSDIAELHADIIGRVLSGAFTVHGPTDAKAVLAELVELSNELRAEDADRSNVFKKIDALADREFVHPMALKHTGTIVDLPRGEQQQEGDNLTSENEVGV